MELSSEEMALKHATSSANGMKSTQNEELRANRETVKLLRVWLLIFETGVGGVGGARGTKKEGKAAMVA